MDSGRIKKELLDLDTCDLCDALEEGFGSFIPDTRIISPNIAQDGQFRVAGPAFTVELCFKSSSSSTLDAASSYLDRVPKNSVIVVSAPKESLSSSWGGLMTMRAKQLGAAATLVDGRCRDVTEHWQARYPVITTRGQTCLKSASLDPLVLKAENKEITFGAAHRGLPAVKISPCDWIVSDINGTVCLKPEHVLQVIARAKKIQLQDKQCKENLESGMTFKQANRIRKASSYAKL